LQSTENPVRKYGDLRMLDGMLWTLAH